MAKKRRTSLYHIEVWPDAEAAPPDSPGIWTTAETGDEHGRVASPWANSGWVALATWAARWGRSLGPARTARQAERYSYTVVWDPALGAFLATVAEFPKLTSRRDDSVHALLDLVAQVRVRIEELEAEHGVGTSLIPDPPGGPIDDAESPRPPKREVIDITSRRPVDGDS